MTILKTTYILKLNDKKNIAKLLKYDVKFKKIVYQHKSCFLYVDFINYEKIVKYFKLYDIILYKIEGTLKYKKLLSQYHIFIISMVLGLFFLYLLSNIIFDIKIMTNKTDLVKIIQNELEAHNFKKYQFVKSYDEKEQIKKIILEEYKDRFEWIEIEKVGTKYYIHLLERVLENKENISQYQNIVARKNAVITKIKASSGEIIRKVNDYVNKGDVIISGNIMKKDEVKAKVSAKGEVYGETWYNVKVKLPKAYHDNRYTGNSYRRISFNILNNRIFLFKGKKYVQEEYEDNIIISSSILPFSINSTKVMEIKDETHFYTYQDALDMGLSLAQAKLKDSLKGDSKILFQKKLKLYEENSTIVIEVFFKVYEDITDYQKIEIKEVS